MTKYIGKKIIVSLAVLLAAGFVLYMIMCTSLIIPGPFDCYMILDDLYTAVRYNDEIYLYQADYDAKCMSFHYFIPVKTGTTIGSELILPLNTNDLEAKHYISPFTRKHIIKRYGLVEQVYTLHSVESIS
ncbi:MAG: hypothetical protein IJM96_00110 [Clostridia bacterium]|nr:hypothetical protein [Clostridia bacterium]MBQ7085861.1 hypothetical protein [Clostridia bacterium]MBQ7093901.1 hypothetical protein [Clostridia bacterium]